MRSLLRTSCVGLCVFLVVAKTVTAQTTPYDEGALRIEGHRGDMRIVRGINGTVVGRVGILRRLNVAQLVGSSERAAVEARTFSRDYEPGTWLVALGIATLGVNLGASQIHDVNRGITTGLLLAGTSFIIYGAGKLERAYNALARSIWWYNRDLKD
jgi:hypothetical protein